MSINIKNVLILSATLLALEKYAAAINLVKDKHINCTIKKELTESIEAQFSSDGNNLIAYFSPIESENDSRVLIANYDNHEWQKSYTSANLGSIPHEAWRDGASFDSFGMSLNGKLKLWLLEYDDNKKLTPLFFTLNDSQFTEPRLMRLEVAFEVIGYALSACGEYICLSGEQDGIWKLNIYKIESRGPTLSVTTQNMFHKETITGSIGTKLAKLAFSSDAKKIFFWRVTEQENSHIENSKRVTKGEGMWLRRQENGIWKFSGDKESLEIDEIQESFLMEKELANENEEYSLEVEKIIFSSNGSFLFVVLSALPFNDAACKFIVCYPIYMPAENSISLGEKTLIEIFEADKEGMIKYVDAYAGARDDIIVISSDENMAFIKAFQHEVEFVMATIAKTSPSDCPEFCVLPKIEKTISYEISCPMEEATIVPGSPGICLMKMHDTGCGKTKVHMNFFQVSYP
jgi:hypothetical protein